MIRVASVYAVALTVSLVACSIARGQSLDFKVDGPTEVLEGDYVELTVLFPEGVKADVDFTPIEESDFGVHPVVSETLVKGKLTATVVGRKCTFSARCMGERDLIVVATAFANFDGVPRLKSLKHKIRVTANQAPNPPPVPPKDDPPPKPPADPDDDLGPWVPLPGASSSLEVKVDQLVAAVAKIESDQKSELILLDDLFTRTESLEKRATAVTVAAPVVVAKPAPVVASTAIVDQRPGHWSVGPDFSPTKAQAIAHLRSTHPAKAQQHEPLESLSLEAVLTLHDDAHEGRASATRTVVHASEFFSDGYWATKGGSGGTAYKSAPAYLDAPMRSGGCPGGVCPTPSRSYSTGRGIFGFRR